jgi:pimeloyl-ACP methyl ester carboxylesterase
LLCLSDTVRSLAITGEHSAAATRAIPNARLGVLPGSHLLPWESPGTVNAVLIQFLAGDAPHKEWTASAESPAT